MEEKNAFDTPATQKNLLALAQNGVLDLTAYERALKLIDYTPSASKWNRFLNTLLLVLGAGFTVFGIYFFFAYNWADMHRFVKLGIIEALIAGLVIATSLTSYEKLTGKITLTFAGFLIGALLAVFGQIYQTGADSYTLFMYWTLFMAGWVFISRFTPMWFIWILLINVSVALYWDQMVRYGNESQLMFLGFLINGFFVLLWEFFSPKTDWLTSRWTPRTLSGVVFYITTAAAVFFVTDELDKDIYIVILSIVFVLINAAVLYVYSQKNLDMFMLTISAISLMVVFDTWFAYMLDNFGAIDDFLPLILGVIIIAETAVTVTLLLRTSKSWEARKQP